MQKLGYFTIATHRSESRDFLLRLVVLHDMQDRSIDHYYEYGSMVENELSLDDSLWSSDPEALLDYVPLRFQFMASMDVRQFLRNDLNAALDGSLMADDMEIVGLNRVKSRLRSGTHATWNRRGPSSQLTRSPPRPDI